MRVSYKVLVFVLHTRRTIATKTATKLILAALVLLLELGNIGIVSLPYFGKAIPLHSLPRKLFMNNDMIETVTELQAWYLYLAVRCGDLRISRSVDFVYDQCKSKCGR